MAKEKMICPFSKRLCEECAQYRARHYYLCFHAEYRGYLGMPGNAAKEELARAREGRSAPGRRGQFEIPAVIRNSAMDPFAINPEKKERSESR
jgi:hypothetical protein